VQADLKHINLNWNNVSKYRTRMKHMYNLILLHPSGIGMKRAIMKHWKVPRFKPINYGSIGKCSTNWAMLPTFWRADILVLFLHVLRCACILVLHREKRCVKIYHQPLRLLKGSSTLSPLPSKKHLLAKWVKLLKPCFPLLNHFVESRFC
jgi:hypothetical protein